MHNQNKRAWAIRDKKNRYDTESTSRAQRSFQSIYSDKAEMLLKKSNFEKSEAEMSALLNTQRCT